MQKYQFYVWHLHNVTKFKIKPCVHSNLIGIQIFLVLVVVHAVYLSTNVLWIIWQCWSALSITATSWSHLLSSFPEIIIYTGKWNVICALIAYMYLSSWLFLANVMPDQRICSFKYVDVCKRSSNGIFFKLRMCREFMCLRIL